MNILKAPFLFNSLNSACTYFVVFVIIECCLNAAFSNHLLLINILRIFLKLFTVRYLAASLLDIPRSSKIIFYSKHSIVSLIFPPYFSKSYKGSHKLQCSYFSCVWCFYRLDLSLGFYFYLYLSFDFPFDFSLCLLR